MSVSSENIRVKLLSNNLNLNNLNVTQVEEENTERAVTPVSDPRAPSPLSSFFQKAKDVTRKASRIFTRPSSPQLPFETVQKEPVYILYEAYLTKPSPEALQDLRQEVKRLGFANPLVQTVRSYAEGTFENAAYTRVANVEKAAVNALGGTILSHGGRRRRKAKSKRTRKQKLLKRK